MAFNRWTNNWSIPEAPDSFVTPAKKVLPYTVTVIGGSEEVKAWRKEQALLAEARAIATQKAFAIRRATAIKMIEEQSHDLKFTKEEREEMRLKNVMAEGDVKNNPAIPNGYTDDRVKQIVEQTKAPTINIVATTPSIPPVQDGFKAKIGHWAAKIWKNAFPD